MGDISTNATAALSLSAQTYQRKKHTLIGQLKLPVKDIDAALAAGTVMEPYWIIEHMVSLFLMVSQ